MRKRMSERPKNRQHETMTRWFAGPYTVRVWTTVQQFTLGPDRRVLAALDQIPIMSETAEIIARTLDGIPDIAGYEILDKHGHGAIVYPDWH